jgi:hypothetical protein
MLHIISLLFSNWIWKICSEMNVYVNVTHNITVILKVNIWKILSEIIVYANVTHHITVILKLNMKNLEWDNCLCKCCTSYPCYSQSKYDRSLVR